MKNKLINGLFILSVILGFYLRLKDIQAPLADWHSWRQADTAAVSREYVKHGIDLLHPQYQDISSMQSGKDNPHGYRMVEFPAINAFVAAVYTTFRLQHYPIHVIYRFVNVILSLVAAFAIFKLVTTIESPLVGLIAAMVFLFLPYSIFYSRTVLPEIGMVTMSLLALWSGVVYAKSNRAIAGAGLVVFSMLALLIKPVAVFLLLPLVLFILDNQGFKAVRDFRWWIIGLISVLPLVLWRQWIHQFPEGIPASAWLFNGNGIRFKGAFFYWLFADRIGRIILGYWGVSLLTIGVLTSKKNKLPFSMLLGSLLYLFVFATGNVQHDYYQIPLLPSISILVAYGIHFLLTNKTFGRAVSISLLVISVFFMVSFSWYHVRTLYAINNPAIVEAGKKVDESVPADALVIAPYMGDTAFLYQTNRRGWPIGGAIETKIKQGAAYYVTTTNDDEAQQLAKEYPVLEKNDRYILIDLKNKK